MFWCLPKTLLNRDSTVAAIETQIEFPILWCDSSSVSLEYPKLANAQPSNFGPLRIFLLYWVQVA